MIVTLENLIWGCVKSHCSWEESFEEDWDRLGNTRMIRKVGRRMFISPEDEASIDTEDFNQKIKSNQETNSESVSNDKVLSAVFSGKNEGKEDTEDEHGSNFIDQLLKDPKEEESYEPSEHSTSEFSVTLNLHLGNNSGKRKRDEDGSHNPPERKGVNTTACHKDSCSQNIKPEDWSGVGKENFSVIGQDGTGVGDIIGKGKALKLWIGQSSKKDEVTIKKEKEDLWEEYTDYFLANKFIGLNGTEPSKTMMKTSGGKDLFKLVDCFKQPPILP